MEAIKQESMSGETLKDEQKTTSKLIGWQVEYKEGCWHVTYYGINGPDVFFGPASCIQCNNPTDNG